MALSLVSGFPKTFTDTTGTLITTHDANWRSDGTYEPKIGTGNDANWCVGQGSGRIVYVRTTANDQAAEAKFQGATANNLGSGGLLVRYTNTDASTWTAYFFIISGANGYLRRRVNTTVTELGTSPDPITFTDTDTLYISAVGTTITSKRNGVTFISATDSNIASGQCGMTFFQNYDEADDFAIYEDAGGGGKPRSLLSLGVGA